MPVDALAQGRLRPSHIRRPGSRAGYDDADDAGFDESPASGPGGPVPRSTDSSLATVEICECPNKAAPPRPLPYGPLRTQYEDDYPAHDVQPRRRAPPPAPPAQGAFDADHFATTHGERYPAHPAAPAARARPRSAPPRRAPFRGRTTYQHEHYARPVEPAQRRPPARAQPRLPFDHATTHQTNFPHPGSTARRELIKPATAPLQGAEFHGVSSYRTHYQGEEPAELPQRPPQRTLYTAPEDRDFRSTKQTAFARPDPACYRPRDRPAEERERRVLPYGPLRTQYEEDYPAHAVQPRQRPPPAAGQPYAAAAADPDHFQTTHGERYKPHAAQRRAPRPASAPPRRRKFRGRTTYQHEHYARPVEAPWRKPPQRLPMQLPFDHATTHQTNFAPPGRVARREQCAPNSGVPAAQPFLGESSYRAHYEPPEAEPPPRPPRRTLYAIPEDRDFSTANRTAYAKPQVAICSPGKKGCYMDRVDHRSPIAYVKEQIQAVKNYPRAFDLMFGSVVLDDSLCLLDYGGIRELLAKGEQPRLDVRLVAK